MKTSATPAGVSSFDNQEICTEKKARSSKGNVNGSADVAIMVEDATAAAIT